MAFLNRYNVRLQVKRVTQMTALNAQHAKQLAEEDVLGMGDSEKIKAQNATLLQENVGEEGGQTLDLYEVTVRFRRNIVLDALDNRDARHWAEEDQSAWEDSEPGSFQVQVVTFMKEKTGEA